MYIIIINKFNFNKIEFINNNIVNLINLYITKKMPNWYSGTVIIKGDSENIKQFKDWEQKGDLTNFARTFVPINEPNQCYTKWGVKWEPSSVSIIETSENSFKFTFNTPWGSPINLWKNIEVKYNVSVEEYGYEDGQNEFYKYYKGKHTKFECEYWIKYEFSYDPKKVYYEYYQNEPLDNYDEEDLFNDWKNDIWIDALDKWNDTFSVDKCIWTDVEINNE